MGAYPLSAAMLIAGAAREADFAEPMSVKANGVIGPNGVDVWAAGTVKFAGDIVASIGCEHPLNHTNDLRVFGTDSWQHVPLP